MTTQKYEIQDDPLPEVREETLATTFPPPATDIPFVPVRRSFPCAFSDEEWKEEIRLSEESGTATGAETTNFYKKWSIAL